MTQVHLMLYIPVKYYNVQKETYFDFDQIGKLAEDLVTVNMPSNNFSFCCNDKKGLLAIRYGNFEESVCEYKQLKRLFLIKWPEQFVQDFHFHFGDF